MSEVIITLDLLVKDFKMQKKVVTQCCECRHYRLANETYIPVSKKTNRIIEEQYLINHTLCPVCCGVYQNE